MIIERRIDGTTISFEKMIDLPKRESIPLEHTYKPSTHESTTSKHNKGEAKWGKISFSSGIAQKENLEWVIKIARE